MNSDEDNRGLRTYEPIEPTAGNPPASNEELRAFVLNACTTAGMAIGAGPLFGIGAGTMAAGFAATCWIGTKTGGGSGVYVRTALGVLATTLLIRLLA